MSAIEYATTTTKSDINYRWRQNRSKNKCWWKISFEILCKCSGVIVSLIFSSCAVDNCKPILRLEFNHEQKYAVTNGSQIESHMLYISCDYKFIQK